MRDGVMDKWCYEESRRRRGSHKRSVTSSLSTHKVRLPSSSKAVTRVRVVLGGTENEVYESHTSQETRKLIASSASQIHKVRLPSSSKAVMRVTERC
ncbi:hypothetical protein E2C01_081221 [Portunus trituberculatus]|uniref:Uncharacterized protein n=1 Tax=Portunus trituberculatus TaxID=210409 RepID=A0A5B7IV84_PORTR|nr:hypothetical protein [Portunus trituberculatus]